MHVWLYSVCALRVYGPVQTTGSYSYAFGQLADGTGTYPFVFLTGTNTAGSFVVSSSNPDNALADVPAGVTVSDITYGNGVTAASFAFDSAPNSGTVIADFSAITFEFQLSEEQSTASQAGTLAVYFYSSTQTSTQTGVSPGWTVVDEAQLSVSAGILTVTPTDFGTFM